MFIFVFPRRSRVYGEWQGRRIIAALDAVAWPAAWAWVVTQKIPSGGLTTRWLLALLVCIAVRRLYRAVFENETYGISTWRWAKVLAWVWLFGMALRLVVT